MNKQKYNQLLQKRAEYEEKLKNLYKGFRGVSHENSAAEIRYSQIKVYEDFIASIDQELRALQSKNIDKGTIKR
jgi:hypothetical protein